jgi:D-inositol-3-phosphate glycosyltransferase
MRRIAVVSVHGCPLAQVGEKDTGGMSVYVNQLARHLGMLGIKVDLFTRAHNPKDPAVIKLGRNVRVVHIKAGPFKAPKDSIPQYLGVFLDGVIRFQKSEDCNYDLLHSHYWFSGSVALELALAWRIPHVATFHTLAEIKRRARIGEQESDHRISVEYSIVASADRIIVSTEHEKQSLRRLYHAPENKVVVVPPGVDLENFCPGSQTHAKAKLGLNGDRTLLYVGRMEPIKGLEVLLHAVASMDKLSSIKLLVVGGNDGQDFQQDHYKELSRTLLITDQVKFLGRAEHCDLPVYYQAADITVVPSYYESFGLVALEAMACGTPVVAARVGGLQTMVKDNHTGYLVPWHCPEAFADRLEILLANEGLRKSMGKEARVVAQDMGWNRTAKRVSFSYQNLWEKADFVAQN